MRRWHRRKVLTAIAGAAVVAAGAIGVANSTPTITPDHSVQTWNPPPGEPAGDLGAACGVERWPVKTGTDPAAKSVNLTPVDATISALVLIPAPPSPGNTRVGPENTVYRIKATVTAYKEEADKDIHLALSDGVGNTMIAELPAASCIGKGSPFGYLAQGARQIWLSTYPVTAAYKSVNQPVTITGTAFFDKLHGQRGVAPNGIEIHPILSMVFG